MLSDNLVSESSISSSPVRKIGLVATALLGVLSYSPTLSEALLGFNVTSINSETSYVGLSPSTFRGIETVSTLETLEFSGRLSEVTLGSVDVVQSSILEFSGNLCHATYGDSLSVTVSVGSFNFAFSPSTEVEFGNVYTALVSDLYFNSFASTATLGLTTETLISSIEFIGLSAETSTGAGIIVEVLLGKPLEFTKNFSESSFGAEFTSSDSTLSFVSNLSEVSLGAYFAADIGNFEFVSQNQSTYFGIETVSENSHFALNGRVAIAYLDVVMFPTEDFRLEHVSGSIYSIKSV